VRSVIELLGWVTSTACGRCTEVVGTRAWLTKWGVITVAAVVALVIAGTFGFHLMNEPGGSSRGTGSCPSKMTFEGRVYWGHGGQVRAPRPGPILGRGQLSACSDEGSSAFEVSRFPGVQPQHVVLAIGGVWVADAFRGEPLPSKVLALDAPVRCVGNDELVGDWISYVGPEAEPEGHVVRPYVAVLEAEQGASLPLRRYASVDVRVHVTSETSGTNDELLAEKSLRGSSLVRVSVHCESDQFVADRIELAE
jgi:hypothetical protein